MKKSQHLQFSNHLTKFLIICCEPSDKNIESAKNLVINDGIQNWVTVISLRTTSKKYGYLNNLLLL